MILWGFYLITHDLIKYKLKIFTIYHIYLFLFVAIALISSVLNPNLTQNIKVLIVCILEFFVIFSLDIEKSKETLNKELENIYLIFIFVTFIGAVSSCIMFWLNMKISIGTVDYGVVREKIMSGIYNNENSLGIAALISIILSVLFITLNKKKKSSILFGINAVIQLYVLLKADARSPWLGLLAYLFALIIVRFKNKYLRAILIVFSTVSSVVVVEKLIKSNKLVTYLHGRYEIWNSAVKLIRSNWLFGVGNFNIVQNLKRISEVELLGIEGGGMHNIFLQILAACGIIALVIFVIFLFHLIVRSVIYADKNDESRNIVKHSIPLLVSIISINLVEAQLIFIVSFAGFLFWIITSYIINIYNS
jgi:O-antigen ligase